MASMARSKRTPRCPRSPKSVRRRSRRVTRVIHRPRPRGVETVELVEYRGEGWGGWYIRTRQAIAAPEVQVRRYDRAELFDPAAGAGDRADLARRLPAAAATARPRRRRGCPGGAGAQRPVGRLGGAAVMTGGARRAAYAGRPCGDGRGGTGVARFAVVSSPPGRGQAL